MLWKLYPVALRLKSNPERLKEEPSGSHARSREAGNIILQQVGLGSQSGKHRAATQLFMFLFITKRPAVHMKEMNILDGGDQEHGVLVSIYPLVYRCRV